MSCLTKKQLDLLEGGPSLLQRSPKQQTTVQLLKLKSEGRGTFGIMFRISEQAVE